MARSARPRDYAAELLEYLRGTTAPIKGRVTYLKRMASVQRREAAAGRPFRAQAARGHKAGREHLTPRRVEGRRVYRQKKTVRGHYEWLNERVAHIPGYRMQAAMERWGAMSFEQQTRLMEARQFAMNNRGKYHWEYYVEEFDLDDEDVEYFGYHDV